MRSRRSLSLFAVGAAIALLPACGAAGPCDPGGNAADDGVGVAVAFDVGGIGDKSFNDAAKRGLDRAIKDGFVSEADCIEPNATGSNRDDNVVNLADAGYDLVFGIGFAFSEGIADIHDQYPEQDFGVVDGFATSIAVNATYVVDLTFREEE